MPDCRGLRLLAGALRCLRKRKLGNVQFGGALHSFTEKETDMPGVAEYDAGAAHQAYRMLDDFIQGAFAQRL